jgi:branched-chain amino acid transport system ATP-binding protein
MTMLDVAGVTVCYGGTKAVEDVSFRLATGEALGIIGPNGAGKSSLLHGIVGLVNPTAGHVYLGGNDITNLATEIRARRGLVLVPEGRRIFPRLSVEENLRVGMHALVGTHRVETRELVEWVLSLFPQLRSLLRRQAGTLSGGEAQMVAIGRALMARPRCLLLDEPTLGLAPTVVEALTSGLAELKGRGLTMLVVEQRLPLPVGICDRFLVLRHGRIVQQFTPEEVQHKDLHELYFSSQQVG